ncbi:hypothetical protein PVT67_17935 [Gallaecimonas kandeliae]|uniref:hypothetical protein n=1 Tax=Gallaecimonas kandeliae TaxID=3029055 RepID=UPI00264967D6|nr:hypothetical protein [Gallaecimonas kandeliae]WKE65522.1 hypothetical protein PVT67_17935 [Gallaecimonas kandeliae]
MKTLICPFCYGRSVHGAQDCHRCGAQIRYGVRHLENWSLYILLFCAWLLLLVAVVGTFTNLSLDRVLAGQGPVWPLWSLPGAALAATVASILWYSRRAPKLVQFRAGPCR